MAYKYDSPYDWLIHVAQDWDGPKLYQELCALALRLDSDTLQDEYESDMERDGYFKDDATKKGDA
jgi:hypothetical protein